MVVERGSSVTGRALPREEWRRWDESVVVAVGRVALIPLLPVQRGTETEQVVLEQSQQVSEQRGE